MAFRDSQFELGSNDPRLARKITMESSYWKLLVTSLVLALGACIGPGLLDHGVWMSFMLIGVPLPIAWCLIVVYAFQQYKRRALWFLLAAPIALCWP
jgi:hypothetical protein